MSNPEGKLRVRATSNGINWIQIEPNSDLPYGIENEYFVGGLRVLIRDFAGHSPTNNSIKTNSYFTTGSPPKKRQFSFQFEGKFKNDVDGNDLIFAAEFERALKPPIGISIAVEFAKLVDPGLVVNLKGTKPSLYSPFLCSMNTVYCSNSVAKESLYYLKQPAGAVNVIENAMQNMPSSKRRKHFQNERERENFIFKKDMIYAFEFFSPYVDFNRFDVSMGITFNTLRYLNRQPVRFYARSKDSSITYFGIEVDLI